MPESQKRWKGEDADGTTPRERAERAERERDQLRPDHEQLQREHRRLARERDRLRQRVDQLKRQLDEARRAARRQAAPFAKPLTRHPRRPGRKPGRAYGRPARIASVAQADAVTITGLAPGEATMTATVGSVSATAVIRVLATGSAEGETALRWTVARIPGFAADTIYANRVDVTGPDLFDINWRTDGTPTIVRALQKDGSHVWTASVAATPMFGDSFGGLVAGAYEAGATSLIRFAGSESSEPWRYDSVGFLGRPAQASDATIYVVETSRAATRAPRVTASRKVTSSRSTASRARRSFGCRFPHRPTVLRGMAALFIRFMVR